MGEIANNSSQKPGVTVGTARIADRPARLQLEDKEFEFPVLIGTEGNRTIDISQLFSKTGHITLDDAFGNTGGTTSEIPISTARRGSSVTGATESKSWPSGAISRKSPTC